MNIIDDLYSQREKIRSKVIEILSKDPKTLNEVDQVIVDAFQILIRKVRNEQKMGCSL